MVNHLSRNRSHKRSRMGSRKRSRMGSKRIKNKKSQKAGGVNNKPNNINRLSNVTTVIHNTILSKNFSAYDLKQYMLTSKSNYNEVINNLHILLSLNNSEQLYTVMLIKLLNVFKISPELYNKLLPIDDGLYTLTLKNNTLSNITKYPEVKRLLSTFTQVENLTLDNKKNINSILMKLPEGMRKVLFMYGANFSMLNKGELIIPEGTTEIKKEQFANRQYIKKVVIPKSVKSIGASAFGDCINLASVVIPEGVTRIGNHTFSGCSRLALVVIPEGVTRILSYTFKGCSSLASVVIPEGVTSIGSGALDRCSSLASVVIPKSVESIEDDAFSGCQSLDSVVIPEGVTSIGVQAFAGCSSLKEVNIPNSVKKINNGAFASCHSLASVVIPDSVKEIGNYAFYHCTNLASVVIPDSVKSIGKGAFAFCSSLKSIIVSSNTHRDKDSFKTMIKGTGLENVTVMEKESIEIAYNNYVEGETIVFEGNHVKKNK